MVKYSVSNPTLLRGLEFFKNFGKALCDYRLMGWLVFNQKERISRPCTVPGQGIVVSRETGSEFVLFLKTCGNTDISRLGFEWKHQGLHVLFLQKNCGFIQERAILHKASSCIPIHMH